MASRKYIIHIMLHWAVQELACLIHDLAKFQNPGFMYKNLKALAFLNLKLLAFAFYYIT